MLSGLLAAVALAGRIPLAPGLLVALVWEEPLFAGPFLLTATAVARRMWTRQLGSPLVAFHRIVANELRGGMSLRLALASACSTSGLELASAARLAQAGRPLEEVAEALRSNLALRPASVAVRVASTTGGAVSDIFDALTAEAAADESLRLERRALTVQARLSVAMVAGFPLAVFAYQLFTGELVRLLGWGPIGVAIVIVGVGLLGAGLAMVGWMLGRARR